MQPLKKTVLSFTGFFHANKAESPKAFPLYHFPNDILTVIFGFLVHDLRKIGSTCTKFRKITRMHENFVLGNLRGKSAVLKELYRILQQCKEDKNLLQHPLFYFVENFETSFNDTNAILQKAHDLELLNLREIKSDVKVFSECEDAMQKRIDEIILTLALNLRLYSCLKIDDNGDDFRTKGIYDALKKKMNNIASSDFSFVSPPGFTNIEITTYTPLMFYNTLLNLSYFRRVQFDFPIQGTLSLQIFNHMNQKLSTMDKVKTLLFFHTQKNHFDWFANNRLDYLKTGISKMAELEFLELRKSEWTTSDFSEERVTVKTLADVVLSKEKKKLKRIVFWGPWHIENLTYFVGLLEHYSHDINVCNTQEKSFDTNNLAQIVKKNTKIKVIIRLEDTIRRTLDTEMIQEITTYSLTAQLKKKK